MIRKNEDQFDSGGIVLKHLFLIGFNDLGIPTEKITEDMVDAYIKEKSADFKSDLKCFIMLQMGYVGKDDNGNWVKKTNKKEDIYNKLKDDMRNKVVKSDAIDYYEFEQVKQDFLLDEIAKLKLEIQEIKTVAINNNEATRRRYK
jgi:hypothetical protein